MFFPSLEEKGVPQLYPKDSNVDYKKELQWLNRKIQLHILELADVLVERPSQYAKIAKYLRSSRICISILYGLTKREQRLFTLQSFKFNRESKLWKTVRGGEKKHRDFLRMLSVTVDGQ
ncbi:unnamed protein product [Thlaspi arvense]|uniref:Mediator of RNA polymerase II transcription subunit 7 n=1 Tax=Thlaspi arvense TaxID=13288 RepID=A0AAU9T9W8_THLAR|nr:unnamed protein product [Thlaspi arvense]